MRLHRTRAVAKGKEPVFYGVRFYKKNLGYKTSHWKRWRKVIAVDFDGTLSLGEYPACGPANQPLIKVIKKLLSEPPETRPYYILWTSRTGTDLEKAVTWLKNQGLVFDGVNKHPKETKANYTRKVFADLYIDDKAITPEHFIDLFGDT